MVGAHAGKTLLGVALNLSRLGIMLKSKEKVQVKMGKGRGFRKQPTNVLKPI